VDFVSGEEHAMQSPKAVDSLFRMAKSRFHFSDDGQDLLEYGLLAALIAIVAIGAVSSVGQMIYSVFWQTIASNF
jgi:Flp pilus assembly pilin Flp